MEVIFTSLSLGLLATTSPCVLPLYPGFLAYLSGGEDGRGGKWSRYLLGFFVLAGVLTMMLAQMRMCLAPDREAALLSGDTTVLP